MVYKLDVNVDRSFPMTIKRRADDARATSETYNVNAHTKYTVLTIYMVYTGYTV